MSWNYRLHNFRFPFVLSIDLQPIQSEFQNLKRDSEALDPKPASSEGPKATNSTAAKTKTANKKRKAASPATDDEEDFGNPTKARKLKAEKIKVEDEGCVKVKTEAEIDGDEM